MAKFLDTFSAGQNLMTRSGRAPLKERGRLPAGSLGACKRLFYSAMLGATLCFSTTMAWAGCDNVDRPQTPTPVKGLFLSEGNGRTFYVEWVNHQSRTGSTFFDIHVRDASNHVLADITGGAGQNMKANTTGFVKFPNMASAPDIFISMRARTKAGTDGCVSQFESPILHVQPNAKKVDTGGMYIPPPPPPSGLSTASPNGSVAPPRAPINKVVQYGQMHLTQKVGQGQCTDLVAAALAYAGDRPGNTSSPTGNYTWGRMLNLWSETPQPGDIIQLVGATLTYTSPSSNATWSATPQHTAIIESVVNGRQLNVIQQNAPIGDPVERGVINLNWTLTAGSYAIFRPGP